MDLLFQSQHREAGRPCCFLFVLKKAVGDTVLLFQALIVIRRGIQAFFVLVH